jgi:hypothetical protein
MSVVNLRALRNEADHLPSSLDEAMTVRRRLIEAGQSRAIADGIMAWLVTKATGEPDTTDAATRSRYRRILATIPPLHSRATGRLLRYVA